MYFMWKISIKLLMTLESLKDVKIKRRLKGIILMFNIIIKETEKSVILKIPRSVKRKGDTFTPSYTIKLFTKLKYYLYRSSYTPRIRSAYVSFKGFTFGRDVTTFCDLNAAPNTIDFQGPNAYNYFFSTMIRYEHSIYRDILKFGVAAELPNVSGTYGDSFASIPQRVPDFPVYMQVNWGRNKESHFRASAVFRDMYLHNESTGNNTSLFGWGVQASGNIKVAGPLQLFFNGVYGEGITPYIQDLSGIGLDFTPNPHNPRSIQTMPMYGWQAAAQIDLVPNKLAISGGYSMAEVCRRNGAYADDEYRRGQYVFGNIFWDLAPCCQLAAEYLYGTRENMDGMKGHANRVNLMVRYNF